MSSLLQDIANINFRGLRWSTWASSEGGVLGQCQPNWYDCYCPAKGFLVMALGIAMSLYFIFKIAFRWSLTDTLLFLFTLLHFAEAWEIELDYNTLNWTFNHSSQHAVIKNCNHITLYENKVLLRNYCVMLIFGHFLDVRLKIVPGIFVILFLFKMHHFWLSAVIFFLGNKYFSQFFGDCYFNNSPIFILQSRFQTVYYIYPEGPLVFC